MTREDTALIDGSAGRRSGSGGSGKAVRRPDLQGMRAVAVLMVFANHLFGWPPGAFVGVDVFFVLSGFFITGLLVAERSKTGKLSFQNFYVRRVKRILPSALLVLTVTVIGSYLLFPASRAKSTLLDALYAALFASNFRFEAVGADYFQRDQPPSPLQHYWSLSIEEQFYFVWPALLVAIFAATRGLRRSGRYAAAQGVLFAAMAAVVALSFGWAMWRSGVDPNSAYFSSLTRVWELGVGALLAIAGPWWQRLPDAVRPVLAYAGLAGVVASMFLINAEVRFPAPWAGLPVLSTALVVASFHGVEVRGMQVLTNPVARWFGDTSYTLYLWHWPVITLLLAVLARGPLFYVAAVGLSLSLTWVTYRFYEDPLRTSTWLLDTAPAESRIPQLSRLGWATLGAVAATAASIAILTIQYNDKTEAARDLAEAADARPQPSSQRPAPPSVAAVNQPPAAAGTAGTANPADCYGSAAIRNRGCALRNPDVPLTPDVDKLPNDIPTSGNCWTNPKRDQRVKSCTLGYTGPDAVRIAFIGDSHARQLLAGLVPLLEPNKWQLTTFLAWGCILLDQPREGCDDITRDTAERLKAESPFDLILVTAARSDLPPENFRRAWDPLIAAGDRIAVIADNPRMTQDAMDCLSRGEARGGDGIEKCGTPQNDAFHESDPVVLAASGVDGATVIDLTDYYCRDGYCPGVIGDVIVYLDHQHITATYIATLGAPLEAGIKQALSTPRPTPH